MGNLKIELDIPEFKDKLEISIVLKRDGNQVILEEKDPVWKQKPEPVITKTVNSSPLPSSGNLMNMDMNF